MYQIATCCKHLRDNGANRHALHVSLSSFVRYRKSFLQQRRTQVRILQTCFRSREWDAMKPRRV
jgi:hypothetical protein